MSQTRAKWGGRRPGAWPMPPPPHPPDRAPFIRTDCNSSKQYVRICRGGRRCAASHAANRPAGPCTPTWSSGQGRPSPSVWLCWTCELLLGIERGNIALALAFLRAGFAMPPNSESGQAGASATYAKRGRVDTPSSVPFQPTAEESLRARKKSLAPRCALQKQARPRARVLVTLDQPGNLLQPAPRGAAWPCERNSPGTASRLRDGIVAPATALPTWCLSLCGKGGGRGRLCAQPTGFTISCVRGHVLERGKT